MRGKFAKIFWLLIALSHGWFLASLLGRGDALDLGALVRLAGLALTIAFSAAELTGRGWLSAGVSRFTRRDALAACVVVALLHAGAVERHLPVDAVDALPRAAAALVVVGATVVAAMAARFRRVVAEIAATPAPGLAYCLERINWFADGGSRRERAWLERRLALAPPTLA